ncbi:flavin reductase family protein [Aureibacter tunicatorum]|uniref:Flavin reductase (DIM6/NTAB) family NADH-FMN oxidoreductase RutF n=1 Tax=Aureibacter tunicatorum TaxID=866807 RepID=A0AAE3XK07_9BACT|nr:flavin reductase [Aureibacter tunicatorum]MDR6237832.1 flavin reductase (DIM6/NTAB) family NADH-FMN oxidoreductase RutF [Aureibacter tunicatorum]BDD02868.1 flavin oxidoreductase [Aureibacter tunicatorum]
MAIIERKDIDKLDKIYRINLVNSLSGFKSANLLGTVSDDGIENVAVFSSVIHLGSEPPLLGFILRPTTVPRNTYDNIKESGVYTINHINSEISEDAHHTSAKYPKSISEFDMTGLTPAYLNNFKAPFVEESPVKIAMKYHSELPIEANGTALIIGEIEFIEVNGKALHQDGFIDLSSLNITTINGLDGYAIPKFKQRYGYQRPKPLIQNINE